MKNILKTFAILLLSICLTSSLVLVSCSNDDEPAPSNQNPVSTTDYFFKAKIDGLQYTADALHVTAGKTTNRITIVSVVARENFEFIIDNPLGTGVGTYQINDKRYILNMKYADGASATSVFQAGNCSTTGTLNIKEISATEISGTFSFTGKKGINCAESSNKVITEGSFKSRML